MTDRIIHGIGANIEINAESDRKVQALGAMVEINAQAARKIHAIGVMVEIAPLPPTGRAYVIWLD